MANFNAAYAHVVPWLNGYEPLMYINGLGADFLPAYNTYILPSEGGYANVVGDKGGETYAGIARNFNPTWGGWTYIDYVKRTKGAIAHNTKFADIQYLVDDFYKARWNANRFGEIKSQEIANLLFDFHVHSQSLAIKTIQRLVGTTADGVMGNQTLAAINAANASKLHDQLKQARKEFLQSLVANNPSQQKFYEGWMARIASFPTLMKENANIAIVLVASAVAIGGLIYLFNMSQEKTESKAA